MADIIIFSSSSSNTASASTSVAAAAPSVSHPQQENCRSRRRCRSTATSSSPNTDLLLLLWLLLLAAAAFAAVSAGAAADPDWTDCPSSCKCKWISGKKTAICREAGLTAVPSDLSGDIQVLDLSGNPIPFLPKDAFRSVGLVNLQRIYLRGSGVKEIHRDAFRDLTILIEVDLSSNGLPSLHTATFSGNNRLRVLDLSGNPMNELREEQFPALPHLRTLEMRSCRLKHVHKRAFTHLSALEALNLSNNRLRYLAEAVFSPFVKLKTLSLDGNPWRCDCHLRPFRSWLLASKLYSLPLTCKEPDRLNELPWQDTNPLDFACSPQVELSDSMVQGEVGGNATFGCFVKGDPEPTVQWYFNGHPMSSNGSDPDRLVEEDEEGLLERWTNVTLSNLTDAYVGEYSCVASNSGGRASKNLTLLLPEVVTATTLSKAESWLLMAGLVAGGTGAVMSALLAGLCLCLCSRQRRRKRKRKAKLSGSVSYTDQEKKLLDVSLTERASGTVSFEGMSQTDMELLTRDPSTADLSEPVHITIESRPSSSDMGGGGGAVNNLGGGVCGGGGGGGSFPGAPYVIPPPLPPQPLTQPSQQLLPRGTLAPPPEFSSALPTSAFGNIFISVSVSQEPNDTSAAGDRYPDLLDIPYRSKNGSSSAISVSAASEGKGLRQHLPYHSHPHHLIHHPHSSLHHPHPHGTSVSVAAASISPYYPSQELPRCCAGSLAQLYNPCEQCVPAGTSAESSMLAAACATLPRRPRPEGSKQQGGGGVGGGGPIVRRGPHYDNMGPRITAGGSSVLSLPEVGTEDEEEDEAAGVEQKHSGGLPPPPPPPICSPLSPEFVSL